MRHVAGQAPFAVFAESRIHGLTPRTGVPGCLADESHTDLQCRTRREDLGMRWWAWIIVVVVVLALVGMLLASKDIARYLRIRRM